MLVESENKRVYPRDVHKIALTLSSQFSPLSPGYSGGPPFEAEGVGCGTRSGKQSILPEDEGRLLSVPG